MKGLSVQIKEDGVWLIFESSSGKDRAGQCRDHRAGSPPSVAEAIREWIEDQLGEVDAVALTYLRHQPICQLVVGSFDKSI
jgi:hypothetical protein